MTTRERLAATLWGVAAGVFGGLFGVGGGILLVPILTQAFGLTQHRAHGTSLAVIGATAAAGLVGYGTHGRVAWGVALLAGLASTGTAPLGVRVANRLSSRQLKFAFALFLVAVAVRLLFKGSEARLLEPAAGITSAALAAGIGAATGLLAGLMGVGGGILAVPAFTMLLGMEQHTAQGTSLAVILITAPAGAWAHARSGNVVGRVVFWLAVGAALGGGLASALVQGTPAPLLTRAFALFLLFSAVQTAWRASREPVPAR